MQFFYIGKDNSKTQERITAMLEKNGHKLLTVKHDGTPFQKAFMRQRDYILASDAVIADAVELETATGYVLTHALEEGKPCLMVHHMKDNVSKEILELSHKNLTAKHYDDLSQLETIIDEFAREIGSKLDAKLFMIIPPEVNKYLEWVATHTPHSKSDIVRSSVLETAGKDKDYQAFLKEFEG